MGVADRIVARLVDSSLPLDRESLRVGAAALLAEEAPLAGAAVIDEAVDALAGMGPIEPLLRDPHVSDVLINGPDSVWVERAGRLERSEVRFASDAAVRAAVERVIAPLGLRLDRAWPAVDARLPDGSRLHAMIAPVAVDGTVVAIRRFTQAVPDLDALIGAGGVSPQAADLLTTAVRERRNVLVAGGTGSGKTTLLNILSQLIPPDERVVTVEDAAELSLEGHVVRLEARPPNSEGAGEVTLRTLVRHALRLRPDRIVVGEVRGPEALDMIQAMSTGHDGSMSTVHANSADEALWRVETLALSGAARVGEATVRRQLHAAIDLVVQTVRRAGRRFIATIAAVDDDGCREVYRC